MSRFARHLPPLETLVTFEAVGRNASFTRAATELCLTQSAVSKQIRALELSLKTELFERQARGMTLTEAGTRLLAHASAHDAHSISHVVGQNQPAQHFFIHTEAFQGFAGCHAVWRMSRVGNHDARERCDGLQAIWQVDVARSNECQAPHGKRLTRGVNALARGDHIVDERGVCRNIHVVRRASYYLLAQQTRRAKHKTDVDPTLSLCQGCDFNKRVSRVARGCYHGVVTGFSTAGCAAQSHQAADENAGSTRHDSNGADDGIRTRDPHLGKVMLYH